MLLFCSIPVQPDFGAKGSRFADDAKNWWLTLPVQLVGVPWACWCCMSVVPRAARVSTYIVILFSVAVARTADGTKGNMKEGFTDRVGGCASICAGLYLQHENNAKSGRVAVAVSDMWYRTHRKQARPKGGTYLQHREARVLENML